MERLYKASGKRIFKLGRCLLIIRNWGMGKEEIGVIFPRLQSSAPIAYLIPTNSTSNSKVALGGITPPAPREP
ncbi:hypothetical protein BDGGKGIB_00631 [Nodularia sphaerocarpa UHCC 0038]|nr:hypothetical protein BDGGKGIB_00631 [Nodularia sphaerocarpa UHCC 0038]